MIIVDWFIAGIVIGTAYLLGILTGEILEAIRRKEQLKAAPLLCREARSGARGDRKATNT